jgi:hypothetical protein
MNRRNWLTAIVGSVAWLVFGRKAQPVQPIPKPVNQMVPQLFVTQEIIDDCCGFIVPPEFMPMILSTKPLIAKTHIAIDLTNRPTIEQVCKLRGIKPLTVEELAADQKRMTTIRQMFASKASNA